VSLSRRTSRKTPSCTVRTSSLLPQPHRLPIARISLLGERTLNPSLAHCRHGRVSRVAASLINEDRVTHSSSHSLPSLVPSPSLALLPPVYRGYILLACLRLVLAQESLPVHSQDRAGVLTGQVRGGRVALFCTFALCLLPFASRISTEPRCLARFYPSHWFISTRGAGQSVASHQVAIKRLYSPRAHNKTDPGVAVAVAVAAVVRRCRLKGFPSLRYLPARRLHMRLYADLGLSSNHLHFHPLRFWRANTPEEENTP
jgi:hypothetical protein